MEKVVKRGGPHSVTLNLEEADMELLMALCARSGRSKTALLRCAIKLYDAVDGKDVTVTEGGVQKKLLVIS